MSFMFQGQLLGIYIGKRKTDNLLQVDQVEAIPGRGLAGDRYFLKDGTFSTKDGPDREVTLIEMESLEAIRREYDITLDPAQARRNLVTRGVPLNHLIGREFAVGDVVLRGLRLCEPCGHLEKLTSKGIEKSLRHRGGLRAQVIRGGILRSGETIRPTT
jgi:MOSC domain-containing protein YiiM